MQKPKITLGFNEMSQPNLIQNTQVILASMTDNSFFPTPTPSLADVAIALENFESAYTTVKSGNRTQTNLKNQYKAELIDLLLILGAYVTMVAGGEKAILSSSGFIMAKDPSPTPPITKPTGLVVVNGLNAGQMNISFDGMPNAKTNMYQYAAGLPANDSDWATIYSSIRKLSISGLVSGTKYAFRVAAIGSRQQIVYSDVVYLIAQ